MDEKAALDACRQMLQWRKEESKRLDTIHSYLHGTQRHPFPPTGTPDDVRRLASMSRVNMMRIVVNSMTQGLYVDGFRERLASEDAEVWKVWQANKMDREQIGIHRAALAYGVAYMSVLPGEVEDGVARITKQMPVMKGWSPRRMTALYGDDADWPIMALSAHPSATKWLYRLYDEEATYFFEATTSPDSKEETLTFIVREPHGVGVTPVIRFLNEQDLDDDNDGEVEPLIDLQDQVDLTTFSLLVAQHFAAFRQRYIIGWTASSETELLKTSASRMLTFADSPQDITVGEFEQTLLDGYLKSREETLKQIATLSQTPVHELIGQLVNLSAEALVAAEAGQQRKIGERQTGFGESWEQGFDVAAQLAGIDIDEDAQVRWRDTESRALAATVDALGKMASLLGIPPDELWDRIPNVTQADIERWKKRAGERSEITRLEEMLRDAAATPPPPGESEGGGTEAA